MQVKALDVVKVNFNNQVVSEIDDCIDVEVEDKKNSSYAISRIAFDCVNGLTGADHPLQKNSGVKRIWDQAKEHLGSQAGRNAELYFYQQILMKLSEKNLLSFDLITAINNRLHSSLLIVDDEFNRIRTGLGKFLRMNRNELAKLEGRLANVERNITLLNWQNAIEYQDLDGIEYAELDDEAKIVCLVRDFYDITGGVWSTSDLLLLKTAMSTIGIKPKDTVNYFEALVAISKNEQLKAKLLGDKVLRTIKEPAYLIPMSGIKKYVSLQEEERYIVESVSTIINSQNAKLDKEEICDNLMKNYLVCEAFVDTDRDVEAYDLLLDMLLNLRHVESEGILVDKDNLEETTDLPVIEKKFKNSSCGFEICQENVGECLEEIARLKALEAKEELVELYEAMVAADIPEGYLHLGNAYYYGEGVEQSYARARKYYETAAEKKNGEAYYMMSLMVEKKQGFNDNNSKIIELLKASIDCGYGYAYYALGQHYYAGKIVPQNYKTAYENIKKATEYDIGKAYTLLGLMYWNGEYVSSSSVSARKMFLRAEELGDMEACYHIGNQIHWCNILVNGPRYRTAEEYYLRAAKAGYAKAYWEIHILYEDNNKIKRDLNVATKYLALGAQLGDAECIADLRYHISQGHVAKDTDVSFLDKIVD